MAAITLKSLKEVLNKCFNHRLRVSEEVHFKLISRENGYPQSIFLKKAFLIRKSHLVDFEFLISKNLQRVPKYFWSRLFWKNARLLKVLGLMGT